MTDTDATDQDEPVLDHRQRARATALLEARKALTRPQMFGGSAREGEVEATDLHALAHYIITGEDPWSQS